MTLADQFIPEWAPQDAVLIAWPTSSMDWAYILPEVEKTYVEIAQNILRHQALIVLCNEAEHIRSLVGTSHPHKLILIDGLCPNDTWARDFAPLSCLREGHPVIVDFGFNAWGMKFAANVDNTLSRTLCHERRLFADNIGYVSALDFICEGGALETDGHGTLMSTGSVLWEPNRNPHIAPKDQLNRLSKELGTEQIHVLSVPAMEGDDTDGHIDTLARFCSPDTIVYNYTDNPSDPDFEVMQAFRAEIEALRDREGKAYRTYPIPIPSPLHDEEGNRLPATYANFLIINDAVLVPIYRTPEDNAALAAIRPLFPDREVIGIDCRALVQQHGSLHCITMQFPKGFIHQDLLH
ncbi:agmatine deiminase family protein [Porphyromonas sp.]|uniref:agmatine deiminase family protein n=1 Tax=Porphyromonas sp. TaxID=1924944 RepID=UPI0026DB1C4A|nr:agmatine deiminase family protein [Porphyromonas sp.]MDO4695668.1 agmatine deiminase family protein [Porphyromonas sp.]MDO4771656.1 agmatine deiminase family protein [Porphyromonas sp.]